MWRETQVLLKKSLFPPHGHCWLLDCLKHLLISICSGIHFCSFTLNVYVLSGSHFGYQMIEQCMMQTLEQTANYSSTNFTLQTVYGCDYKKDIKVIHITLSSAVMAFAEVCVLCFYSWNEICETIITTWKVHLQEVCKWTALFWSEDDGYGGWLVGMTDIFGSIWKKLS